MSGRIWLVQSLGLPCNSTQKKNLQLQALPQAVAPLASLQRRLVVTNHTRTARNKRNGEELKINGTSQNTSLRNVRGGIWKQRCLYTV